MAFKNFSNVLKIRVLETGELVPCGTAQPAKAIELQYLQLVLFVHGSLAGTEKVRVKLFNDTALTKLFATSNWASVAAIPGVGVDWIGWLRFDFARQFLSPFDVYSVAVETTGYTRNVDTSYLGVALDYLIGQSGADDAAAMALYGYRWAS